MSAHHPFHLIILPSQSLSILSSGLNGCSEKENQNVGECSLVPQRISFPLVLKEADFLFSFVSSFFFVVVITMKCRNVDAPHDAERDPGHPHKFTRTCKSPCPRAPLLATTQRSARQSLERRPRPRPRRQTPSPEQHWGDCCSQGEPRHRQTAAPLSERHASTRPYSNSTHKVQLGVEPGRTPCVVKRAHACARPCPPNPVRPGTQAP